LVDFEIHVVDRGQQPILTLLNQDRLTVNDDGSVLARPNQPLKLEYFLRNAEGVNYMLYARQFSDLDTLDLASPSVVMRDSVNGHAVTLTLRPTAALVRQHPYSIGMRGQADIPDAYPKEQPYSFAWSYAYIIVGEQQPTSTEEELAKAGFILYPNPIPDRFVVEAPDLPAMYMQLLDATGKAVGLFSLNPGRNHIIKPATMANDLYFFTIRSRYRPVGSGRLVVQ
jgi:hypothetical protein